LPMGNKGFSLLYTLKVLNMITGQSHQEYRRPSEEHSKLRSACMFVALNRYLERDWVNFANA
jgi:hypothetical protein